MTLTREMPQSHIGPRTSESDVGIRAAPEAVVGPLPESWPPM